MDGTPALDEMNRRKEDEERREIDDTQVVRLKKEVKDLKRQLSSKDEFLASVVRNASEDKEQRAKAEQQNEILQVQLAAKEAELVELRSRLDALEQNDIEKGSVAV